MKIKLPDKIDSLIPLPPPPKRDGRNRARPPSPWLDFLRLLSVGDSFRVEYRHRGAPLKYMAQLGFNAVMSDERWNGRGYRYVRIWRDFDTEKFSDLEPEQRTRRWIESAIQYENAPGIHAYHQCKCRRKSTRSGRCALCWQDLLAQLPKDESV